MSIIPSDSLRISFHEMIWNVSKRSGISGKRSALQSYRTKFALDQTIVKSASISSNAYKIMRSDSGEATTPDNHPFAGRNTGRGPDFWNLDLRLSHTFKLREPVAFQVTAEAFNLMNRENFASVNNTVGAISGPFNLTGRADRSPSEPLGFTSVVGQRRIQLGARLFF